MQFTLLLLSPLLWGAPPAHWLVALGIGTTLGPWLYLHRDRHSQPGPDADERRFPR